MLAWIAANWGYLATVFWVLSEVLNQIPSVKSNSFLEFVINALDSLFAKQAALPVPPAPVPPVQGQNPGGGPNGVDMMLSKLKK